jgi:hypothetical protein
LVGCRSTPSGTRRDEQRRGKKLGGFRADAKLTAKARQKGADANAEAAAARAADLAETCKTCGATARSSRHLNAERTLLECIRCGEKIAYLLEINPESCFLAQGRAQTSRPSGHMVAGCSVRRQVSRDRC